ncbi:MAG: carboxypeptidase regulatory-like domain-containing protein [Ignavibacteriae bacterium]|nr:carboxypeptidase regulatory-like domain-containing protein [Ignavibacteria bacterium]MBI3363497.1 carboxypeptidase regulatory-like domain-containing protein [Ignavibacteriota bacterium]
MFASRGFAVVVLLLILTFVASSLKAGNITGKINFTGAKPALSMIKMNADPKCMKMHGGKDVPSEQAVVNSNKTLQYVFVYVKKGLEGKKFPTSNTKLSLNQQGCMYHPHVFGMMTKQPLEVVNSDQTLHNIHALPKNSTQFNIAQPIKGMKLTKTFDKPEVMVKVKCEVHNWMAAYIGVLDHPFFAVSDDQGKFEIKNLPPGEYELEAWHEKFGTKTMKVSVGASDTKTADFTY